MIAAPLQSVALFQKLIDAHQFWRGYSQKVGLLIHGVIERQIVAMHQDRGASVLAQFGEATDVVDVRVRADDGFDGELVAPEEFENAGDFVAGINDQSFAGDGVRDDGAVALDRKSVV